MPGTLESKPGGSAEGWHYIPFPSPLGEPRLKPGALATCPMLYPGPPAAYPLTQRGMGAAPVADPHSSATRVVRDLPRPYAGAVRDPLLCAALGEEVLGTSLGHFLIILMAGNSESSFFLVGFSAPKRMLGKQGRLVAPHAVAKGGTVLVERPLVVLDDVGMSPARSLLCAACGIAAGTPSQQVSCMQGQSRRGAVLRPRRTLPALLPGGAKGPAAHAGAGSSASCGDAATCPRAGCDVVWCSPSCRARQRYEHLLTCCGCSPGGPPHGTYAADLRARLARCGGRSCAGEGSSGECCN